MGRASPQGTEQGRKVPCEPGGRTSPGRRAEHTQDPRSLFADCCQASPAQLPASSANCFTLSAQHKHHRPRESLHAFPCNSHTHTTHTQLSHTPTYSHTHMHTPRTLNLTHTHHTHPHRYTQMFTCTCMLTFSHNHSQLIYTFTRTTLTLAFTHRHTHTQVQIHSHTPGTCTPPQTAPHIYTLLRVSP